MLIRCRHCRAWRLLGRVIRPTAETPFCRRCDPKHAAERYDSRLFVQLKAERVPIRQWLLAAPVYTVDLLVAARAAHPGPIGGQDPWAHPDFGNPWDDICRHLDSWGAPRGHPVPWVDTLELDVAAVFLHSATGLTRNPEQWPPATEAARLRLRNSPKSNPATRLDIGAAFGQRGFPFPPDDTRRHLRVWDGDGLVEEVGDSGIEIWAGLSHLLTAKRVGEEPTGRTGAEVLPVGYADALALELRVKPFRARGVPLWTAVGSVYRDAEGRIVVLWR